MLTQQQLWTQRTIAFLLLIVALLASPAIATAQDQERPSPILEAAKRVVFDPTTWAPAILAHDATMRDWKSSQPIFQHGFVEHNRRFTISGLSNDTAVSYSVGQQRILADAVPNLEVAAANNL